MTKRCLTMSFVALVRTTVACPTMRRLSLICSLLTFFLDVCTVAHCPGERYKNSLGYRSAYCMTRKW